MRNKLKRGWHRREWTVNTADPTAAVQWKFGWMGDNLEIKLIGIWCVEAEIRIFGRTYSSYDALWATQLFDWLESKWEFEQGEQYDPEVAAAERAAGWDSGA